MWDFEQSEGGKRRLRNFSFEWQRLRFDFPLLLVA